MWRCGHCEPGHPMLRFLPEVCPRVLSLGSCVLSGMSWLKDRKKQHFTELHHVWWLAVLFIFHCSSLSWSQGALQVDKGPEWRWPSSTMESGKWLKTEDATTPTGGICQRFQVCFQAVLIYRGLGSCAEIGLCCFHDSKHDGQLNTESHRLRVCDSLYFQKTQEVASHRWF